MPTRRTRQLQQLLTKEPQQRQQQSPYPSKRRMGGGANLGSSSNPFTADDSVLICCYKLHRSSFFAVALVLFFLAAATPVLYSSYDRLLQDDDRVINDDDDGLGDARVVTTEEQPADELESTTITKKTRNHDNPISIQQSALDHLQTLTDFPRIVHLVWPDKEVLSKNHEMLRHGARNLRRINPNWEFVVHDYDDVDDAIRNFRHPDIPPSVITDLARAHTVEKTDAFRLMVIYERGGLYVDIDRVMNVDLDSVIDVTRARLVVPTYYDINFANDLFGSSPRNRLMLNALRRQCEGRARFRRNRAGWIRSSDQMKLVRAYTASMERDLVGRTAIGDNGFPWEEVRRALASDSMGMIVTYRDVWCDGLLVNDYEGCKEVSRDSLYEEYGITSWKDQVDKAWEEKLD